MHYIMLQDTSLSYLKKYGSLIKKKVMIQMDYKKDCGFREKVSVCGFIPEDCRPEKCDMFEIPFSVKGILKQSKKERKEVVKLTEKLSEMKKNHEHKTKKEEYEKVKADRKDRVIGMMKLSKAYVYCKRTNKDD